MFNSKYAASGLILPNEIPHLALGFDTETTGLWKPTARCECADHRAEFPNGLPIRLCHRSTTEDLRKDSSIHEPITYGFTMYKNGQQHGPQRTFTVLPANVSLASMMNDKPTDKYQGWAAIRTHGWTEGMVRKSYDGGIIDQPSSDMLPINEQGSVRLNHHYYAPAIDRVAGMRKAASILADARRRNIPIVGANVDGFDLDMLRHHYEMSTGTGLETSGFDLDRTREQGGIYDVIRHQWEMDGKPTSNNRPKYRPLSSSKIRAKDKDTLCDIYGVREGDHTAAEDARASLDVLVKQIMSRAGAFTPNPIRIN